MPDFEKLPWEYDEYLPEAQSEFLVDYAKEYKETSDKLFAEFENVIKENIQNGVFAE